MLEIINIFSMTLKTYTLVRAGIAMVTAAGVSFSVVTNNYPLAAIIIAAMIGVALFARSRIKEIVTDERDYGNAGTAARYAMTAFALIGAVISFVLMALRSESILFEVAGSTLAYSVCALLILHSAIFAYLNKATDRKQKTAFFVSAVILIALLAIASARFFTPEDTWLCQNGEWIRHGNPATAMPTVPCN